MSEETKKCCRCSLLLPLVQFDFVDISLGTRKGACKACIRIESREYRQKHKDRKKEQARRYNVSHRAEHQIAKKAWEQANPDKHKLIRQRAYQKRKSYIKEQQKQRYHTDPEYRITLSLRKRLNAAIKEMGFKKQAKTLDLLGCTPQQLKAHLESLFQSGMTWDNYGFNGWHIDHILPCASFDLNDPEQQRKCFHYTNLQPLWAIDNLRKNDSINYPSLSKRHDVPQIGG